MQYIFHLLYSSKRLQSPDEETDKPAAAERPSGDILFCISCGSLWLPHHGIAVGYLMDLLLYSSNTRAAALQFLLLCICVPEYQACA